MRLVQLTLVSRTPVPCTDGEASLLHDSLWAHAGPQHALEHVWVCPIPQGINVALFVRADTATTARARAHSLLSQVLRSGTARRYALGATQP